MRKALIIGAGPAGLTAAYELLTNRQPGSPAVDNSYEVIVFEETEAMGGISKTVNHNGNRMDMGGHRFFSKVPEVNEWWEKMLPEQGSPTYDDILLRRKMPVAPFCHLFAGFHHQRNHRQCNQCQPDIGINHQKQRPDNT